MMSRLHAMSLLLGGIAVVLLASCKSDEETDDGNREVDLGDPAAELVLPDYSDIDIDAAFTEAIEIVVSARGDRIWAGHERALARRFDGCPDIYVGAPEGSPLDDDDSGRLNGMSWSDFCTTPGGLYFRGFQHWTQSASASGDPTTSTGRSASASRNLTGNGVAGDTSDVRFEWTGAVSDAVTTINAGDYFRYTWSTETVGTATGTDIFEPAASLTPGGWRADTYVAVEGGDVERITARGDLYMFEKRIADRFDSVSMNIEFIGELGAGPDDCTLEPRGWIGLRDENAWWLDIVFQPVGDDDGTSETNEDDYTVCDGCGTAYVRGVEQTIELGELCIDMTGVWGSDQLAPADPESYVFNARDFLDD
jgi:hypothetical protein